ncbi:ubiquinone/menaquinone biosynthesis methyltransferase UBIE [Photobacterium aphoticum]|uniref:Ubiquinone/menaquinone biosynthesis methyltransferase UBIE n=1 Tax=Photobacterium aphoticum TaxID=754436 RepID=A0A090QJW9_9GAMM|nr:ubiquinone/menaquinone biosynthesis methyltransferase UBIE [Photobacterium aphoticum]
MSKSFEKQPSVNPAPVSKLYSQYAEQYDVAVQDNVFNAHYERPSLQALIGEVAGCDVLDLGCGTGVYAQYMLDNGAEKLTCIDYSPEMVEIVNRKFGGSFSDRVTCYAQDLSTGLPNEADESMDLVISPLMIHYLEDLTPLFSDIARVLRKGGRFVFSTHHPFADIECSTSGNYFEREIVRDVWDTVGVPVDVQFYRRSLTEIMQAISGSGMVVTGMNEDGERRGKSHVGRSLRVLVDQAEFHFYRLSKTGLSASAI